MVHPTFRLIKSQGNNEMLDLGRGSFLGPTLGQCTGLSCTCAPGVIDHMAHDLQEGASVLSCLEVHDLASLAAEWPMTSGKESAMDSSW